MTKHTAIESLLDIATIAELGEAEVEIKHPTTGAPTGATVTLAGPEHPKRKQLIFTRTRKLRAKFQKSGKVQLDDPEDEEVDGVAYLAACTLGWKKIGENGKEIPFTPQAAVDLYTRIGWLRAQVSLALEEKENFIQACAPT